MAVFMDTDTTQRSNAPSCQKERNIPASSLPLGEGDISLPFPLPPAGGHIYWLLPSRLREGPGVGLHHQNISTNIRKY